MQTNEDPSTILRDDYPDGMPGAPDAPGSAPLSLTEPGAFVVGCNYWASHAGTAMWRDWRPDVVDADLKQLAEAGLQVLRVFPLWPDFQPITQLYTGAGRPMEMRHGEAPLPDDEAGRAGVSAEAMARFAAFADLAEQHGLKLIVGLVTGWMSGRLFVPPGLEGRNVLTDPVAIMWQVRFVQHFVRRFRHHPAILAWDLGNECNCMAPVPSHEAAWTWTAASPTPSAPRTARGRIVSGHAQPGRAGSGAGQLDHRRSGRADRRPDDAPLPLLHPAHRPGPGQHDPHRAARHRQTRWYGDCGGKPALTEEIGTLGPMVASERIAADFARNVLFSLWAHDCHGLLWWCAYDQGHLTHAPYDWHAFERELGLIRADRSPKPVLGEIGRFAAFLAGLPIRRLPPRHHRGGLRPDPRAGSMGRGLQQLRAGETGGVRPRIPVRRPAAQARGALPGAERERRRQHVAADVAGAAGARPQRRDPVSFAQHRDAVTVRGGVRAGGADAEPASGAGRVPPGWRGCGIHGQRADSTGAPADARRSAGPRGGRQPDLHPRGIRPGPGLLPRRADRDWIWRIGRAASTRRTPRPGGASTGRSASRSWPGGPCARPTHSSA